MIFSDARFIFLFFPLAWVVVWLVQKKRQPLLVASVFIAISFGFYLQWNPSDFVVVISSILINFAIANTDSLSQHAKVALCVTINVRYLVP